MSQSKEGALYKQGGLTSSFSKRYCILQYNLLLVFKSEPSQSSRGSPSETINVSDAIVRGAEGHRKFGFQVVLPGKSGAVVTLAATTAQEAKDWMDAIKEAAGPVPTYTAEDKPPPGRWDVPEDKKGGRGGRGGGGPSGNVVEKAPPQTTQPLPQTLQQQQPVQYGQQSQMQGQQPMQYPQQPMQYPQQPMQYGQQPMQYGQQPMQYGQQPMQYGQQPMQYGQQPMQYGQQHQVPPQAHAPPVSGTLVPQGRNPYGDFLFPSVPQDQPALDPARASGSAFPNLQ